MVTFELNLPCYIVVVVFLFYYTVHIESLSISDATPLFQLQQ